MILNFFDTKISEKAIIDWNNTQNKDFRFAQITKKYKEIQQVFIIWELF